MESIFRYNICHIFRYLKDIQNFETPLKLLLAMAENS